jgi:adenylate kinase
MIIVLTGTPGCGKTTLSKELGKKLDYKILELNKKVKKNKLYSGFDKKRNTYIIDQTKVKKFVNKETKQGNWIIDSHVSHILKSDIIIVLRCDPNELRKRLKKKRWKKAKIDENIEAELIGIISYEARKKHKKVFEIDTTKKSIKDIVKIIQGVLKGKGNKYKKPVNWLYKY